MPLIVYTSRLPTHGQPGYVGPGRLDITRGTGGAGGSPFAPSRPLLDEANRRKRKAHNLEHALTAMWAWYAPLYMAEMRGSYVTHRPVWLALLARPFVVLCCYCGTAHRCHRRLLAEILVKLGAHDAGELPRCDCSCHGGAAWSRVRHPTRGARPTCGCCHAGIRPLTTEGT